MAPHTALLTGASRGIGLALAQKLAAEGHQVIATARNPEVSEGLQALAAAGAEVLPLDVADFGEIDEVAERLAGRPIDLLVNNAAVMGPEYADQAFGVTDYDVWMETLRVNALAPMKMMEAFVEHVAASERKLIVNVSSIMASCAEPRFGGIYTYRTSKTLLNGISATAAQDLQARGVAVVAIHPGYVRTALGSPTAEDTPESAVDTLWPVLEGLGMDQTGQFLFCDGSPYPW